MESTVLKVGWSFNCGYWLVAAAAAVQPPLEWEWAVAIVAVELLWVPIDLYNNHPVKEKLR